MSDRLYPEDDPVFGEPGKKRPLAWCSCCGERRTKPFTIRCDECRSARCRPVFEPDEPCKVESTGDEAE